MPRQIFKNGFSSEQICQLDDDQLIELKKILLQMLSDFISVVKAYQISYSLCGGSLLGAVRNGGFIPWDDDLDVVMPRADYIKFLDIFEANLGDKYVLCSPERTHNHGMLCAQMKRKGTIYRSFNELTKPDDQSGVSMDIYVWENTFNNKLIRTIHGIASLSVGYLSTCRKTAQDYPLLKKYIKQGEVAHQAFRIKAIIGNLFRWLPLDTVTKFATRCYSLCHNQNSTFVTIPSGRGHYFGEMHYRKDMCVYKDAKFENLTVNIPVGYALYLTALYGEDFMELPPAEKREKHPLMEINLDNV